jgi:hypothetical protein
MWPENWRPAAEPTPRLACRCAQPSVFPGYLRKTINTPGFPEKILRIEKMSKMV